MTILWIVNFPHIYVIERWFILAQWRCHLRYSVSENSPCFLYPRQKLKPTKCCFELWKEIRPEKLLMSQLMMRKWAKFLCLQHNGYSKLVYFGMYVAISWGTQNNTGYAKQQPRNVIFIFDLTLQKRTILWSGPCNTLHVQQHWLHTESTWHAWLKTCFRTVWLFVRTTCLQQAYFYFYLTMMLPQRSCFLFKLSELLLLGGPWLLAVFRSGLQWHMVLFHTSWCFVVLFTSEVSEIPPMIKNNFPDPAFQPLCKKHFFPRRCFG